MARSPSAQAEAAAEAVEAFLRSRSRAGDTGGSYASLRPGPDGSPDETALAPNWTMGNAECGPENGTLPARSGGEPLRLPNTDWLHHRMTVDGPRETVVVFREAAAGAGTVPWQLDLASLEEDWFHRLVDPAHRSLSLQGARVLAAQLRDAVERRHAVAVARVGHSRACPFDLHSLVPVPPAILARGPDHPEALLWLWEHWGTTEPLRHVSDDLADKGGRGRTPSGSAWQLEFWSADWTPWRALARIRADWPALHFDLRPDYATA